MNCTECNGWGGEPKTGDMCLHCLGAGQTGEICSAAEDLCHGPCTLPAGHVTEWHRDEDGTQWNELADWERELLRQQRDVS